MVEIKIGERSYRVKNRVLWEGLEKMLNALNNNDVGALMRYTVLFMCENPRFSEAEILKRDGAEIFELATQIVEQTELKSQLEMFNAAAGITEAEEIKKKETMP